MFCLGAALEPRGFADKRPELRVVSFMPAMIVALVMVIGSLCVGVCYVMTALWLSVLLWYCLKIGPV